MHFLIFGVVNVRSCGRQSLGQLGEKILAQFFGALIVGLDMKCSFESTYDGTVNKFGPWAGQLGQLDEKIGPRVGSNGPKFWPN